RGRPRRAPPAGGGSPRGGARASSSPGGRRPSVPPCGCEARSFAPDSGCPATGPSPTCPRPADLDTTSEQGLHLSDLFGLGGNNRLSPRPLLGVSSMVFLLVVYGGCPRALFAPCGLRVSLGLG